MVLGSRDVARPLDLAADEPAGAGLVERPVGPGEDPEVVDEVFAHRAGLRPVHLSRAHEASELLAGRREAPVATRGERGADQDERDDAIGVVQRQQLRERAARRDTDQVGAGDPVAVEYAESVGEKVVSRVPGASRLIGDRTTGVAVVVADHEPSVPGEHPAKALLPPEHRSPDAHDEQDRRVARIAEGLGADLGAIRIDHALGQGASSFARRRRL
jgi:hypothetical protein